MTIHSHHDTHCEHEVKVCACCDVAYCKKCSREWGKPCTQNHYPYYWTNTWPQTIPSYRFGNIAVSGNQSLASSPNALPLYVTNTTSQFATTASNFADTSACNHN